MKIKCYPIERRQFLVRLAYRGSDFFGVQPQPGLKTVLGALAARVEYICGQYPRALTISARTDRGVHALENFATFWLRFKKSSEEEYFKQELCGIFEDNLLDVKVYSVHPSTHARGIQRGKRYRYSLQDNCLSTVEAKYCWKIAPVLDVAKMKEASEYFLGIHDFSSFKGHGCQSGSPIKQITEISIVSRGDKIHIEIFGNSFLRKMIRNMVGLLVEIGAGLKEPQSIPRTLLQKNRKAAGITAPAHGLTLLKIASENFQ